MRTMRDYNRDIQKPVRLYMTFTITGMITGKIMITVFLCQWLRNQKSVNHFIQFAEIVSAFCTPFQILLERGGSV